MRLVPKSLWARLVLGIPILAVIAALLWWRGPDWNVVYHAFDLVNWAWIAFSLGLNLLSVLVRSLAWRLTINHALDPPQPAFGHVFSAFSIGLLGNAVLPGRIGELARVAVLRRHVPRGRGSSGALVGTVFAHRLFDLFPALLLVLYVLSTAKIPNWAVTSLVAISVLGILLFAAAVVSARRQQRPLDGARKVRQLLAMARQGLAVLRSPLPALGAIVLQTLGWFLQLLAVYVAMRALDIHAPLPAAALVLLLMNVATIFPLWPGNIGLMQAAVALPLVQYGVAYSTGFAYGLVLQVLEMSVGVAVGLIFLAREGLSFATLRELPSDDETEIASDADASLGGSVGMRALACPASLKGVLGAFAAARALGDGMRAAGADVRELPVADGGEGTADVLHAARGGEWREAEVVDAFGATRRARWLVLPDGTAVVEAAAAVPLDLSRLDLLTASSRGFGLLVAAALEDGADALLLTLGGTATMDAGAGFLEVVRELPVPARAACDVTATLLEAPRLFGPQKGAGPEEIGALERAFAARKELVSVSHKPGSGAAGGLGAALALLGAELVPGAALVLDAIGFDASGYDLVVTGEGRVDATTRLGKAPGEVVRRSAGTRCVVFGGVVEADVPGAEVVALSGDPSRAEEDLAALGRELVTERH